VVPVVLLVGLARALADCGRDVDELGQLGPCRLHVRVGQVHAHDLNPLGVEGLSESEAVTATILEATASP
jgi:hypothetical protein